jgi:ABC-type transport system involved in multi-copper enzyme maturation permease subunit
MQFPDPAARRVALAFAAGFALLGLFVMLAGLGVFGRSRGDAPGWIVIVAGAAFVLAAASLALSAIGGATARNGALTGTAPFALRLLQTVLGLGLVALLAVTATWVALHPGDASGWDRRAAFSAGAAVTWIIFVGFALNGLRQLRN